MEELRQKKYEAAEEERGKQTKEILSCKAKKKVVVAGPGTGKTYLFQELLSNKSGNRLALTFINALVDDLSLSLSGLSEVRTLHGYALSFLKKAGCKLFPKLPIIIEEDVQILDGKSLKFESIFQQKPINSKLFTFYKERKDYYGNYYGYSDIIYALVEYLKNPKNKKRIPDYEQIVVDEFQDFNEFEVELIELLAQKNPILITGDDDQSLYEDLKKANPKYLREKYGPKEPDYTPFSLSYCSRSTEVIVGAINDFITTAKKKGFLDKDRVKKIYNYFPCKKMDEEGVKNQKIIFRPVYYQFLPDFFKKEISEITIKEKKFFDVLIIIPNVLKNIRFPQIIQSLKMAGFKNIHYSEKKDKKPTIIDGLSILKNDPNSNLGWRIMARIVLKENEFEEILKKTNIKTNKNFQELLGKESVSKIKRILDSFQKVIKNENIDDKNLSEILFAGGYDLNEMAKEKLKNDFYSNTSTSSQIRNIKNIRIGITTIVGSKGLSADYVFLTDFSDKYFGKKNIINKNIYDFIVTMTRARKKIYLLSPDDKEATFLSWIKTSRIDRKPPFLIAKSST